MAVNLRSVAKLVNKKVGDGTVATLSNEGTDVLIPYKVPTGCPSFDYVLGGGLPGGRIVELFSHQESEGKSTLAYQIARECQKIGGIVILFDIENSALSDYMMQIGIDVSDASNQFMMSSPETIEKMFETSVALVEAIREKDKDCPILVILDSVAASVPLDQFNADFEKNQMAGQARAFSTGLRVLNSFFYKNKVLALFLNQSRQKIGMFYGDPNVTPGGKALKFYASVRIALRRIGKVTTDGKKESPLVGIDVEAHVIKSKVSKPFQKANLRLLYDRGFDFYTSAMDLMIRTGKILISDGGRMSAPFLGTKVKTFTKSQFKALYDEHKVAFDTEIGSLFSSGTGWLASSEVEDIE